jgi:hypothetical protein
MGRLYSGRGDNAYRAWVEIAGEENRWGNLGVDWNIS